THQAGLYGIPDRGRIEAGAFADLLLFDPAAVAVSPPRRVNDLPGGGPRTIRDPLGIHGVFVNGTKVFDGTAYCQLAKGPGQVLARFLPTGPAEMRSAAGDGTATLTSPPNGDTAGRIQPVENRSTLRWAGWCPLSIVFFIDALDHAAVG